MIIETPIPINIPYWKIKHANHARLNDTKVPKSLKSNKKLGSSHCRVLYLWKWYACTYVKYKYLTFTWTDQRILILFNLIILLDSLFYGSTLFVDFAVFIKSWEYKLMSIELLFKFHKVHRCQKNKRDILKSARGASLHFMWILISSVSHNYE